MTLTVACSGFSAPSAQRIAEQGDARLVRSSTEQVDVNWGRSSANARLNSDTTLVTNKREMRLAFRRAGVPMPHLLFVANADGFDERDLHQYLADDGVALGRPDRHTKHRGMWLIRNERDLAKALAGTRKKHAATHFMEWIESEREYRCHIFQGRSIRISRKDYSDEKTWVAVRPGDIPLETVRDAARQAVAAVGLDFGAVDILARGERNDEVFVLEVNSAPGLGGSMPRVYFDTFMRWIEREGS